MNRFSQKDSWRGYDTVGLSQNRFACCVNDPVNLYDFGGNRYVDENGKTEGSVNLAHNIGKGMSVKQAIKSSKTATAYAAAQYLAYLYILE